jgi:predicted amidohydrolase
MEVERRHVVAGLLASTLATAESDAMTVAAAPARPTPPAYAALALQLTARSVERAVDRAAARAMMLETIASIGPKLRGATAFISQYGGSPVRLAVLPEYLLTSFPLRIGISEFADKAAIAADGPEYEALGQIASDQKLFLAGNAYETDRNFPGLYFQSSFLIAPSGDVVLRYRRLNSMFAPTPHDVWSRYLDIYGLDGVFPVARTEIGNLAAIASEEILYPEIARAHTLRGAEVFVHSSSEIGSPIDTNKDLAKRARAFENLAYVISANTAGISGTALPLESADGNSSIVDYKGNVLAESNTGETFTAFADVDLAALRAHRRKPGMINYLARQRTELFAPVYAAAKVQAANGLLDGDKVRVPERDYFSRVQAETIERLARDGLI